MNIEEYLASFSKFGTKDGFKPGLERIRALLKPFIDPDINLPIIHVAGSNGKGSTIAFLESIYQKAGYRVGVYTSPHLVDFAERIRINEQLIKKKELIKLIELLAPVVDKISKQEGIGQASYFELVTALAFLYFKDQKPDLILMEVGLGGRLDATNVIKSPLASVITSISLEHTAILGDTVEKIAFEKAGIIKKKRPVLTGVKNRGALDVINKKAKANQAKLTVINQYYQYKLISSSFYKQEFSLIHKKNNLEYIYEIGLRGEHQIRNAILAQAVVRELNHLYPIKEENIYQGLKEAFIPGRLELVNKEPYLLLDGAHNQEGIEVLVDYLNKYFYKEKKYIIISVLNDKNIKEMLSFFNDCINLELIITENTNQRSLAAIEIKKMADSLAISNTLLPDLKSALLACVKKARKKDLICVTGSLYTISELKILLKKEIKI